MDFGIKNQHHMSYLTCDGIGIGQQYAVRSQKVVSTYFTSEQILPFGFAEQK